MSTATTSADGGRGIHALCDDALMEILVLLPDKSVLCCRAVCRRWRRVTNDRSFLAGISARCSLKMITILSRPDTEAVTAVPLSAGDDGDDPASPAESRRRRSHLFDRTQLCWDKRTPRNNRCFDVDCSLDGLLVLYQRPGLFVVCNPVTRQWTNLPALPPDPCGLATIACGFYSHGSSGAASMAVWDLRDYDAEVWTLRCRVEVPMPRFFDRISLHSVGGGGDAILIARISNSYYCRNEDSYRLYDLKETRLLGEISFSREEKPTFLVFRESFVSHVFFSRSPRRSSEVAYINFSD